MCKSLTALALLGALFLADRADATAYCIDNAAQLQQALNASAVNGVDDTIRLAAATFISPVDGFQGDLEVGHSVTIDGGYLSVFGSCNVHVDDPSLTVIDGNGLRRGMHLFGNPGSGGLLMRNLSFHNGRLFGAGASANRGAGLSLTTFNGFTASVTVERAIFRNNRTDDFGAALALGGGIVHISTSLFTGNIASEGSAFYVISNGGQVYVNNNTIAGNTATLAANNTATVLHSGSSDIVYSNNILWQNTTASQYDLYAPELLLLSNNIQRPRLQPLGGSVGNTSVDPKFVDTVDYRLKDASPLINQGIASPLGGIPALDLDSGARVQNGAIDLGAYENSRLFTDGFE